MRYRVWIAKDMNEFTKQSDYPYSEIAFFEDVDQEGLELLMKFVQHQGCAIAIMPALPEEEE